MLRALHDLAPNDVNDRLAQLARHAGAVDVVAYLVDFEQSMLFPIPDRGVHVDLPVGEPVRGTLQGRAFTERKLVSEPSDAGVLVCVPIFEGSECTGVLALTLRSDPNDDDRRLCEELGMFAGAAISIAARYTDLYNLVRRRKAMSLPASMQWDLLPPLRLSTNEATSNGLLEPAYDIGGDSFDHAANGFNLDVAILDAMGHGLAASLTASLAVGCYRHDRREGQPLRLMHEHLDAVVADRFGGAAFVTGQLARLDVRTGELTWVNAGHPGPLLVRDRRVVRALRCQPSLPWGLGGRLREQAVEMLRPGDGVVFYTDGVVEGRSSGGESFGIDRLVEAIEEAASSRAPTEVIVRQAIHEVLRYQNDRLRDDATLVWVDWHPSP
ncbi:MAG: Protein serine/threonine phosphatase [Acidimicrobiaceae bacterium]|nr:Protein serine/threonine phosphatase [Acidimicrobiaceae bacterium]